MKNIYQTLLKNLFENPCPQPQNPEVKTIYRKLYWRMYPDDDDFILFLQTQDIDIQYRAAESILEKLCIVSNFPPSKWAITDTLSVDDIRKHISIADRDPSTDNKYHVLRDHYLHLVYLYLLGIYIFFYDEKFYSRITEININARVSKSYENQKILACKDFISEWKYFCLYHDVGYSHEVLNNARFDDISNLDDIKKLCGFNDSLSIEKIGLHHSITSAIEIISKTIVTFLLISHSQERSKYRTDHTIKAINSFITRYSSSDNSSNTIKDDEYYKLQNIFSNSILKFVLTFFNTDDLLVVATNKSDGSIAMISLPNTEGRLTICDTNISASELTQICENPELLFFDDLDSRILEFNFYIKSSCNFTNTLQNLYDGSDPSKWDYFLKLFYKSKYSDFLSTTNEKQIMKFYFDLYKELYELYIIKTFNTPDTLELSKEELQKKALNIIFKNNLNEIKSGYIKTLEEKVFPEDEDLKDTKFSGVEDGLENYIKYYIKKTKGIKDSVYLDIEKTVTDNFYDNLNNELICIDMFISIQKCLLSQFKKSSSNIDDKEILSEFVENKFMRVFDSDGTPRTKELIENFGGKYNYPYGNRSDHGVESAKYAAKIVKMYRGLINSRQDQKWVDVLLDITNPNTYSDQYISNYSHIFENVISAVFYHNLYIDRFKDTKLKTMKIRLSNSFVYMAMLCDALQQWNRPYSEIPDRYRFLTNNASGVYDIEVKNGTIYVYEDEDDASQERLKKNFDELSKYMSERTAVLKRGHSRVDEPTLGLI